MAGPTRTVMQLGRPSFRPSLAPDAFFPPPPPSQTIPYSSSSSSSQFMSTPSTTAGLYTNRMSTATPSFTSPSSRLANISSHPALSSTYSSSPSFTPTPTPTPNVTMSLSSASTMTVSQSSQCPISQHISLMQKRALLHTVWPYVWEDSLVRVAEASTDLARLIDIWRMTSLFNSSSSSSSSSWLTTPQGFTSFFSSLLLIGEGGFKKVLSTRTLEGKEEALSVIELDTIRRNRM